MNPSARLFTPGPLTTSATVKSAMLRDLGSRDDDFLRVIRSIRENLLHLAGAEPGAYETVLVQGSGTFAVESAIGSTIPPGGGLLAIVNGAYGERIAQIATVLRIPVVRLAYPENRRPVAENVAQALEQNPWITHIAMVHSETTSGLVNPIEEIGEIARQHGKRYIVDAMSSFGAIPVDLARCGIDYLVSSANKCIEGVPGFAFVLARRAALEETKGWSRSLSLDLYSQWAGLEKDCQFRFTPPVQVLLAFERALRELDEEGGVTARLRRYRDNQRIVAAGLRALGIRAYLEEADQGPIITSFHYPDDPNFDFEQFYRRLHARGFVIYPGKLSRAQCFRIGHIGQLFAEDMQQLVEAVEAVLTEMGVELVTARS